MRNVLVRTAQQAGTVLLRYFRKKNGVKYKASQEIQNAADLAADRIIAQKLRAAFPRIPILSEEGKEPHVRTPHGLFIVDPLDGTTNFTFGNPIWGVNIAHVEAQAVIVAVSHLPTLSETYSAVRGRGAWRGNTRIRVSSQKRLSASIVVFCHGYKPADLRRGARLYAGIHPAVRYCRMFGSAAFEMAMVASGGVDGFIYSGPKPWDIAPGVLLIEEAGGTVTDERGRAWVPGREARVLVCTNGLLHESLLALVRKTL